MRVNKFNDLRQDSIQRMRDHIRGHTQKLPGSPDSTGLEMMAMIKMISNLYSAINHSKAVSMGVSGPRWRILLHLEAEEDRGSLEGVTPTEISRCQNVSKNTISALLRGLEDQGLVERTLDPVDRRIFRIRISEAGRSLIRTTAPRHVAYMHGLLSGMPPGEQEQLLTLLDKLYSSLLENSKISIHDPDPEQTGIAGG